MSSFNLIDAKWIHVCFSDSRPPQEMGIRDTLLLASEIRAIEDPSPLVVASLYRLLLAILYRAIEGPTDISQARELFRNGLPEDKITAYLEKWHDGFWLFDEHYPFGQVPRFKMSEPKAWTVLATEHNADNAKVLFDHVEVNNPGSITCSEAARWLLATQSFSVPVAKSILSQPCTAPSATAAIAIPMGRNLLDTLLFCLVPQSKEVMPMDIPLWERDMETLAALKEGLKRTPWGYADRYTWRIRSVNLETDGKGSIQRLSFASGVGVDTSDQADPMVAYRVDEERGRLPVQFRERGIWRDFDSLLPADNNGLAPMVIEHAVNLTRSDMDRFPRSVMVLGQANDKAKIKFWRMEHFALPQALVGNVEVRSKIRHMLQEAEDVQKSLWAACKSYASDLISRGQRKPDKSDIASFIKQMPSIALYWSALEADFHEALRCYTLNSDPDNIDLQWLKSVRAALRRAWEHHRTSIATSDAWAIRAFAKADGIVGRKLLELDAEIKKLTP